MNKSNQNITFQGGPTTVSGSSVEEGKPAPDFLLTGSDMSDVKLADYKDKVLVVISLPSVETPVCDSETRKFNEKAASLDDNISILAVSLDLPFAQKRYCEAEGINAVRVVSDYKHRQFSENYGTYVKELGLLARGVFVIGKDGLVKHVEYVSEIAEEPDYEAALAAAKAAL